MKLVIYGIISILISALLYVLLDGFLVSIKFTDTESAVGAGTIVISTVIVICTAALFLKKPRQ